MPLTTTSLNQMMATLAGLATHLSLHSADPGATGLNQTTAARQLAGWSTPANGQITAPSKVFTGGANSGPVTHVGLWSAATGGTFYGSYPIAGDSSFNSSGSFTLSGVTLSNGTA